MKRVLVNRFIEVQALLLSPITPHFSDYVWRKILKNANFIWFASFPKAKPIDQKLLDLDRYIEHIASNFRQALIDVQDPKKKKGPKDAPVVQVKSAEIVVATRFPEWVNAALDVLNALTAKAGGKFPDKGALVQALAADARLPTKQLQLKAMGKASFIMVRKTTTQHKHQKNTTSREQSLTKHSKTLQNTSKRSKTLQTTYVIHISLFPLARTNTTEATTMLLRASCGLTRLLWCASTCRCSPAHSRYSSPSPSLTSLMKQRKSCLVNQVSSSRHNKRTQREREKRKKEKIHVGLVFPEYSRIFLF